MLQNASELSPLGAQIRRQSPERYLAALFAPDAVRETLFTLYAFDHELARARVVASQPGIALIRLQWWREVVEGVAKRHEVATPLHRAVQSGALPADDLLAMIAGREVEDDAAIPDLLSWQHYHQQSTGCVLAAAGFALGADADQRIRLRLIGAACGAAATLRDIDALATQSRCLLPEDVLHGNGLSVEDVMAAPHDPRMQAVRQALSRDALALAASGKAPSLPRTLIAAVLPLVPALKTLHAQGVAKPFGLGPRLAMIGAGLRGRLRVP